MTNVQNSEEIWKDIIGYEGLYQVSNFGRVKSLDRMTNGPNGCLIPKPGKIIKQRPTKWGYMKVKLSKKSVFKHPTVHRLVAIHFIPNPENKPQVNHIDCDRKNNNLINLEWCTPKENQKHALENGRYLIGERSVNAVLTDELVVAIKILISRGMQQKDIAKELFINAPSISRINIKKTWKHIEI